MKNKRETNVKDNVTAINDSVETPQPLSIEQLKALAYDYAVDIDQKTVILRQIQAELATRTATEQSN